MKSTNKASKGTLKKVLSFIKPYSPLIVLSILLAALSVALTLYMPIIIGDAIDCAIGKGQVDFDVIRPLLINASIIIAITALAQWIMNVINNKVTYQVVRDIRNEAFEKIQALPLSYIDTHPIGDTVSRIIADVDQFADGLLMGFSQFFTGIITIIGTLVIMLCVEYRIAIVVVVLTPLSLFIARFIAKRTHSMFAKQSKIRGEQTAIIEEMIGNQKVVKAFSFEDRAAENFDKVNDELAKCSLRATFFSSLVNPSTRFVNSLVYAAVALVGCFCIFVIFYSKLCQ